MKQELRNIIRLISVLDDLGLKPVTEKTASGEDVVVLRSKRAEAKRAEARPEREYEPALAPELRTAKEEPRKNVRESRRTCPECGTGFSTKQGLSVHRGRMGH